MSLFEKVTNIQIKKFSHEKFWEPLDFVFDKWNTNMH